MALRFGTNTTDNVNCGTGASITNMNPGTSLIWALTTNTTTDQRLLQKGTGVTRWFMPQYEGSAGNLNLVVRRATVVLTASAAVANFAVFGANKWLCFVATWDHAGANGDQKLLVGDTVSPVREPSSYVSQTVGSGAVGDNSASALYISSNLGAGNTWLGSIAFAAMWNRILTPKEYLDMQAYTAWLSGLIPTQPPDIVPNWRSNVLWMPLGLNGKGQQVDYSPQKNIGTVTGAVVDRQMGVTVPYPWIVQPIPNVLVPSI